MKTLDALKDYGELHVWMIMGIERGGRCYFTSPIDQRILMGGPPP
jgi:hypothetical protein